jgi:iron complex outermembrane recepter protein
MRKLSRTINAGVSLTALMLVAAPAFAQNAEKPADDTEIVVTGSYLPSLSKGQGTLDVVGAKEIQNSIKPSITAILAELPATQGNFITGGSNDSNNSPAQTINLRGLGTRATLVLLNGQRQTAVSEPVNSSDSFAVDLNTLVPTALISRVEVLKDGASALYGSDAVAGVANFITRKDLDGLVVQADGGLTTNAGRKNGKISIAGGVQGENTSIVAGLEYAHQDQIFTRDIFNDEARIKKFGQTSGFGFPATFFFGGVGHPDPACGTVTGSFISGTNCRFDLTVMRGMVAQIDRGVGYTSIEHRFSDKLRVSAEFGGAYVALKRTNSIGFLASNTGILPGAALRVPASNPGNPYGVDATMNFRTGSISRPAITDTKSTTVRARLKLDYDISDDWNASVGGAYSTNSSKVVNGGYYATQRFQDALNCVAGPSRNLCYNPFASALTAQPGSPLANSPAVLDWVVSPLIANTKYALSTFDALITGKLFQIGDNEPVRIAIGAQNRHESTSNVHDVLSRTGGLTFGGPAPDYSLARTVNSVFAELQVPLMPGFEINAAARLEDSKPGGSSINPKVGFSWRAVDGLTFSGSFGKSQRAPGLLQFTAQSILGSVIGDKYVPSAQNGFAVLLQPSTGLKPESSTNFNFGANLAKDVAGGRLAVNLSAWNIDFKDLITGTDVTGFILANPDSPAIVRNPSNRFIISVTVPGFRNANKLALRGLDFDVAYSHPIGSLTFNTRVGGTLMDKYDFTNAAGVTSSYLGKFNTAIAPIAKLVLTGSVGLSNDNNSLMLTANYKSALHETTRSLIGITAEKSFTTFDLAYHHSFSKGMSFNFGVVNLFDVLPPAQGNNIYTTNASAYPLTGRAINAGFRVEF